MDQLAEGMAAGLGGIICTTVLYPLEIVKNQLQVMTNAEGKREPGAPKPTFRSVALHIWKMDGARGLMWGNTPSCAWGFVEKLLYFYSFAGCRWVAERITGGPMSTPVSLLVGYACEWTHLPFTMPLEVWTVRVQHTRPGTSIWRTLWGLYEKGGVRVFFKSASAFLVLATKPAIKYTLYERVRQITIARRNLLQAAEGAAQVAELGMFEAFILGAAARSLAEVLIYPVSSSLSLPPSLPSLSSRRGSCALLDRRQQRNDPLCGIVTAQYTRAKMVIVGRSKDVKKDQSTKGPKQGQGQAVLANLLLPVWTIKEIFLVRARPHT